MAISIGGFFELESNISSPTSNINSVFRNWIGTKNFVMFSSARSIVLALKEELNSKTVWVPEIFCNVFNDYNFVKNYPLEKDGFNPEIDFLESNISEGDLVLLVDFYGVEVGCEFRDYAMSRKSIFWLQDACHNLLPSETWTDFTLFSPRKLFGVTDGGVLVQNNEKMSQIDFSRWKFDQGDLVGSISPILRRIDPHYEGLYQIYSKEENSIDGRLKSISELTKWQLNNIEIQPFIERRKNNFSALDKELHEYLIPNLEYRENFIPFGFPIYIENRDEIRLKLAKMKIFAPIHWINDRRTKSLRQLQHESMQLTLPCDHRYTVDEMANIAKIVQELI